MDYRAIGAVLGAAWLGCLLSCTNGSSHAGPPDGGEPSGGTEPPPLVGLDDADADGLPNYLELLLGSDPGDHHSPYRYGFLDPTNYWGPGGDGIVDGLERYLVDHGAAAPVTVFSETDADGIPDYFEVRYGTDPFKPWDPVKHGGRDEDDAFGPPGDGITDALETLLVTLGAEAPVTIWTSTDGDAAPDYIEVFLGTDPFDASSFPNIAADPDGDGLPTYLEIGLGSEPFNGDDPYVDGASDRDGDEIPNGLEDYLADLAEAPPDSITYQTDSDADGVPDVHEVLYVPSAPDDPSDPIAGGDGDLDDDLIPDGLEGYLSLRGGDPDGDVTVATDHDLDGLPGVLEVTLPQGVPYDPERPYPNGARDGDGDGVENGVEHYLADLGGTPPIITPVTAVSDSDCDGRPDATEVHQGFDPQAIDLERYAESVLPDVITFDHNGQFENNTGVRYVVVRVLSTQRSSERLSDRGVVNLHEIRFRDSDGRLLSTESMRIVAATRYGPDHSPWTFTTPTSTLQSRSPLSLFDGVGLDQGDPDPTRWKARDDAGGLGMYTARDFPPYVFVVIDLGEAYDLQDMLIWNGLQSPGRAAGRVAIELLSSSLDVDMEGGPGGVENADGTGDLSLWVRADQGTSTHQDGAQVAGWTDQSGYARDAYANTTPGPIFHPTSPANGRPVLEFNRDDMLVPRPVDFEFSIFIIAATTRSDSGNWWETDGSFLGHEIGGCDGDMGMGFLDKKFFWAVCGITVSDRKVNDGDAHVLTVVRNVTNSDASMYIDGALDKSADSETGSFHASDVWGLGQVLNGGRLIGEMWEAVIFTRPLNITERNIVDNYLSSKYAIPIEGDHYSLDDTHGNEVAGIGRTFFYDTVTHARAKDMVEIFDPTALQDGDRLLWGSDDVDPFSLAYDVPAGYIRRIMRSWGFEETSSSGGVGRVSVRFSIGHINATPESSSYALLVDSDTRFQDATVASTDAVIDPVEGTVTFNDVLLGRRGYFTLAIGDR